MKKRYFKRNMPGFVAGSENDLSNRKEHTKDNLTTRTISLRFEGDTPATLNEEARTVEVLASTENPVTVWDWDRGMIEEILLMDGLEMPSSRKVPLLDAHSRYTTSDVVGSFRGMLTGNGELNGTAHFSSADDAQGSWTKVREGHITDFSVGYLVQNAEWVPDGESRTINGRTFQGPVKVVTSWKIRELSVVPIGADEYAKARSENNKTQPKPQKKESIVDAKLRAFLERRGLAKDATEDEAYAFLERMETKTETPSTGNDVDVEGERNEATTLERIRNAEITAMGVRFDCADLATTLIKDGKAIDDARAAIMDKIAEDSGTAGGTGHRAPAEVGADERDKFRAAATDAVMLKAGTAPKERAAGAEELAGRSLVEIGRMSLVRAGFNDNGLPMDVIGRALTTSDFPMILGAAANKSLEQGFELAEETWDKWCGVGAVNDFKIHTAARASETDDLDEVPEGTEYKYGERSEAFEQYGVATYGKILAITRQAIINDDLGALSDVPYAHGESASRKVGDVAYAVLIANALMGDGKALFIAAHNNIRAGAVPGVDSVGAAIEFMKKQKDIGGKRRLNLRPRYFLAPVALEGSSEVFFKSEKFDGTAKDATRVNPYSGNYFERVYESRLDDDSATAWYLLGPNGKTVKVFFLNGQRKPRMESRQGWSVDGVEYKVSLDVGAKAMDWRAMQKNPGA